MYRLLCVLLCILMSCSDDYQADQVLTGEEYTQELMLIAPYVIKKPDEFSFEDRFKPINKEYYLNFINETKGRLSRYHKNDSAIFFFFEHKDITSLYDHYRGLGGYLKKDSLDKIYYMNLLYHTPRFTRDEMDRKSIELFREMVKSGNVNNFIGNSDYIHTPNTDFYYNTTTNRWDYTEHSSWKFLEKAREQSDSVTTN
jgi:hypothetical protein